jgi:hypothetical protein
MCAKCEQLNELLIQSGQKIALVMEKMETVTDAIHQEQDDDEGAALGQELADIGGECALTISRLAMVAATVTQSDPVSILGGIAQTFQTVEAVRTLTDALGEDEVQRILGLLGGE